MHIVSYNTEMFIGNWLDSYVKSISIFCKMATG